jgi:hypothetical protein
MSGISHLCELFGWYNFFKSPFVNETRNLTVLPQFFFVLGCSRGPRPRTLAHLVFPGVHAHHLCTSCGPVLLIIPGETSSGYGWI